MTIPQKKNGFLLVVSSPSGAGKTSLTRALVQHNPKLQLSISITTRPPRPAERDGTDYHFVSLEKMSQLRHDNALLEHAEVFGHHYGTLKEPIMQAIENGDVVVCDVDWQGAQSLRRALGQQQVSVFIMPPSLDVLKQRLHTRAQDEEKVLKERFAAAQQDIAHWHNYDYTLINDDFARALEQLQAIIQAEFLKTARIPPSPAPSDTKSL